MMHFFDILGTSQGWMYLFILSILEIVLGIDNIIFISIVTDKLPKDKKRFARNVGLSLALVIRLLLLTMVDTWATVGSCAQIGKNVHLSGGVGIGGILEPLQAAPVIIEDNAFIGSRCIVVEGVRIGKEAVLGANVVLTQSTKIIDVTGTEPKELRAYVPERSVVIPGSYTKQFPAGEFQVPCALIIGQRKASTDLKTSLNNALREHNVAV